MVAGPSHQDAQVLGKHLVSSKPGYLLLCPLKTVYQPRVPNVLQAMEPWVSKAGLGDSNSRGQVLWPPPGPAPTAQQFTVVQPHLEPEMVGGHLVSFPGQEPSCLLPSPKLQPGWPGQVTDRHFVCPEGRLSWEMSQQVVRQLKENGGGSRGDSRWEKIRPHLQRPSQYSPQQPLFLA